jgi:hypothetical protein
VQLERRRCALFLGLAVAAAGARPARAAVEAASTLTVFQESSSNAAPIQVVHPQADVSADLGKWASANAG